MRMKAVVLAALLGLSASAAVANAKNGGSDIALTVYNNGPAVVWETRAQKLEQGTQTIGWPQIPAQLIPESLWLAGDHAALVAATIDNGLAGPNELLAQRIGKSVTLLSTSGERRRKGTLVSLGDNAVVVRIKNQLELINDNSGWRLAWPAPQDGNTELQLTIHADQAGSQPLTLAYQRDGVNWHASYTGRLDAAQNTLTLQSLAVLENNGDAPLQGDQVALIAGDVARSNRPRPLRAMAVAKADSFAAPEAEAAGNYYRYRLQQPAAVPAGATQVLALLPAQQIDVERTYRIESGWYRGMRKQRNHASVRLKFANTTGQPLPAGPVRVYGHEPAMLLGEDRIGNIPDGAPITLELGRAFDITSERHVIASSHDGKQYEQTLKVTVYNARGDAVEVKLIEHLPQGAEIVDESSAHASQRDGRATWQLQVPGQGETSLTYTVRWQRQNS